MSALEEAREILLRPGAEAGTQITAQIGCRPGIELCALEIGAAAVVERFFLEPPTARRVAGAAMAKPLDEIGAAVPSGVVPRLRDIGATDRKHHVPDRDRPAPAQISGDFVGLVLLPEGRYLLHEEIIERVEIIVGDLGVGGIRHRRIEPMPILGDAGAHSAVEILEAVIADPGIGIRRDVG